VAILVPPSTATGSAALLASGRAQTARRPPETIPEPVTGTRRSGDVLDELREEG